MTALCLTRPVSISWTHYIRAACTSKAKKGGIPLQVIVKTAGWANAKVFSKHYDKPVKENSKTVQQGIWKKHEYEFRDIYIIQYILLHSPIVV